MSDYWQCDVTTIIIIIIIIMKTIPVTLQATGPISKSLTKYLSNIPESRKLRNCKQEPFCSLHTDCGKC